MIKYIMSLCLLLPFVAACRQVSKENWDADTSNLNRKDLMIGEMHYVIISESARGTFVINYTKDSLEVSKLLKP